MSDEPLYCVVCGREECDHDLEAEGPYCHVCGVIPAPGWECKFYNGSKREGHCIETGWLTEDELNRCSFPGCQSPPRWRGLCEPHFAEVEVSNGRG